MNDGIVNFIKSVNKLFLYLIMFQIILLIFNVMFSMNLVTFLLFFPVLSLIVISLIIFFISWILLTIYWQYYYDRDEE